MNNNASSVLPNSTSAPSTPPITSFPPGTKFSSPTSEQASPESISLPLEHVTSDGIEKSAEKGLGPSAFEGTGNPFLARVFSISTTEIQQLELGKSLGDVDSFILGLVKERNWVDNEHSYNRVLSELKANLGIDESLQPLLALERLSKGVKLLRLQKFHRRRDQEILKQIQKLT